MSVAKKFLEELQSGNITEAIEIIQSGLRESAVVQVEESRKQVLESYGFKVNEKKDKAYEEEDEEELDDDDEEEEDE